MKRTIWILSFLFLTLIVGITYYASTQFKQGNEAKQGSDESNSLKKDLLSFFY